MVSRKVPNASSTLKIECDSSIQTYATVKKQHSLCTCEIVYYCFNGKIESGQNVSYKVSYGTLKLEYFLNICLIR